jgi:hypothetical protein
MELAKTVQAKWKLRRKNHALIRTDFRSMRNWTLLRFVRMRRPTSALISWRALPVRSTGSARTFAPRRITGGIPSPGSFPYRPKVALNVERAASRARQVASPGNGRQAGQACNTWKGSVAACLKNAADPVYSRTPPPQRISVSVSARSNNR